MPKDAGDPQIGTLRLSNEPLPEERISPDEVRVLHERYGKKILTFLFGVLRDWSAAQDVSQTTFRRLMEAGHNAEPETIKGWLFTVAIREALEYRRKISRDEKLLNRYSQQTAVLTPATDSVVIKAEEVEQFRTVLRRLPHEQQLVVRKRLDEDKPFAAIAEELQVPLNTVLTRMRLAVEKLRKHMNTGT